jgi:DNA-binding GntR family transcriptional regulator
VATTASITDLFRADILAGKLLPGTRLVELSLAEQYAVSRAAVRGAISELVKEGLVDHEANRGATVRRVAIEEAIQITEVRAVLESLIAAQAATRATKADRTELKGIIAEMKSAVEAGQTGEYSELNQLLHRRLREIAGHTVAADLVGHLRNRAAHHAFRLALIPGRPAESLRQHQAIVAAVVTGKPDVAAAAMRAHIDSVTDVLRRWAEAGVTI